MPRKYWIFILLPLCAVLAFTPLSFLSFIILVYLVAVFLPLPRFGLFSRLAISLLIILSTNTLVAGLGWIFNLPLHARFIVALYYVIFFVVVARNRHLLLSGFILKPKRQEVFAALLSFVLFLITILPVAKDSSITNAERVVAYGGDNLSHLEMVNADAQTAGYTYKKYTDGVSQYSIIKPLTGYPQGLHINVVFLNDIAKPLHGGPISSRRLLLSFQLISSMWFALLAYLFITTCFELMDVESQKTVGYIVTASVAGWLFLGVFFTTFTSGFQTQIAALVLLLSLIHI